MPERGAIRAMRRISPNLNGDTELSAKPTAVTAVASATLVAGAEAARINCQRQPRIRMKPTDEAIPANTSQGEARPTAAATWSGWTVRRSP